MIWIAGTALAFIFVKLGALLVLVKLFAVGLGLALFVNLGLALALFWRKGWIGRIFQKKTLTE